MNLNSQTKPTHKARTDLSQKRGQQFIREFSTGRITMLSSWRRVLTPVLASFGLSAVATFLCMGFVPMLCGESTAFRSNSMDQNREHAASSLSVESSQYIRGYQDPARGGQSILPEELMDELLGPEETRRMRTRAEATPGYADRHRKPGALEKQSAEELRKYEPLTRSIQESVVAIETGDKLIGYGAVVRADGVIVAKASEVNGRTNVTCRTHDGSRYKAKLRNVNKDYDLILLEIDVERLPKVSWGDELPSVGTMVVSGNEKGSAIWAGIVGVETRPLIHGNQAVLGVVPQPAQNGVLVSQVAIGSSADVAGVRVGDIVESIDGRPVDTVNSLTNRIRNYHPGDQVVLSLKRNGKQVAVDAVLGGRDVSRTFGVATREFNQFGAEVNERSSDFPLIFQHDMPLWPEQTGSLVLDIEGNVIGFNIARGGRIESYAIPAPKMKEVVLGMLEQLN